MENSKIEGIRTAKPMNQLSPNLARAITSAMTQHVKIHTDGGIPANG